MAALLILKKKGMIIMRISEKGLSLIKEFEGCFLNAYRCPSHVLTIGWGHTGDVYEGQYITQEEADNLLINDMLEYENYVNSCTQLTFTPNQNQFDALVSFTYNCGQGNLATLVQNRDAETVAEKLLLYNRGSDGVLPGLVRRREAERELFSNGDCESIGVQVTNVTGKRAELQELCNTTIHTNLVIDDIWGPNTDDAAKQLPLLKFGSSGPLVVWVQLRLEITPDGKFGEQTKKAVEHWQSYHGLTVDSTVGYYTYKSLATA